MDLEGSLVVRLAWDGRVVRGASVRSTRPLAMPRVLGGRAPAEAAAMVPRLFSVCAHAQGSAAASALASAQGAVIADEVLDARTLAVALEAIAEDLRRLMIDVPTVVDVAPAVAPVAAARKAIAPVLSRLRSTLALDAAGPFAERAEAEALRAQLAAIVRDDVLGVPAEAFVGLRDANALVHWAHDHATPPARVVRHVLEVSSRLGSSEVPPMPAPTREALAAAVAGRPGRAGIRPRAALGGRRRGDRRARAQGAARRGRGFRAGARQWRRGSPARAPGGRRADGARARPCAARSAHRRLVAAPPAKASPPCTRRGACCCTVRASTVAASSGYAIVAPTEWNFHPEGALVRGLVGRDGRRRGDAAAREANLLVQALDPCVACEVEVGHA